MTGRASSADRAAARRRAISRLETPRALVGVGIVSLMVALGATFAFRHVVERAVYVFFWGAVCGLAALGGFWAGMTTALVAVLLADFFLIPPLGFGIADTSDVASTLSFVGVSALVSWFAEMQRRARREANEHLMVAQDQATELEMQKEEAQTLAEELEQSNSALEVAIANANTARSGAEESERVLRLLDDASRLLASSLDYEATVGAVAQLAVPGFADWCAVDLLVDGQIRQLAVAHVDPDKVRMARDLHVRFPPNPDSVVGIPQVIRTGEPLVIPRLTDAMLDESVRDPEQRKLIKAMQLRSVIVVPMQARGKTLGTLTLISTAPDRQYGQKDLGVMRELANRAALAVDNAQLYRAALAANEAKANFLATMSHELRTPLTAIIGYEELLAEGITAPINDAQRQQLDRIKVSALHLLGLIEEILTYARIEAGRESVRLEPVPIKGVVDDAVAFVEPMARAKRLKLDVAAPDPGLMIRTDAGKVRQVLVNLLSNAVKFTDSTGEVRLRSMEQDHHLVIEVADTGIGIPPEHLERIFDPFWQVEQHTTRTAGGSGLGLSVTRRLVDALGGKITVESQLGHGSTFRVALPLGK